MKWSHAALLFLAIVALMVANSANFFFHQPFYEIDDWAANSLSVNRAKHFAELYGNYSRWGFHHPGPAFFYLYALGEWLFYDSLHLVAAPFNGQLLIHLGLMTGFFVAVLAIFSRSLPRGGGPWFLPVALGLSALHFAAMANLAPDLSYTLHAPSAIASPWSAHALVMPLLCLLTVTAGVAAGRGQYLPLLAFTDGCLVHTHVAQPLFVLPLTLLAYGGLCWQGWRGRRVPWQEFGGSHILALFILGGFALPIVGDFFRGPDSNMALILHHIRTHHGEHKPLVRSIFYFLQFGSYTEYSPHRNDFGRYDLPGALAYLRRNAAYYILWLAAVILALWPLARSLFRRRDTEDPRPDAPAPDAQRFLAWGGVALGLCTGLTLFWGVIQDGPMTYFNAWFNYSIYQFTALLALGALCARPGAETQGWPWWRSRLAGAAGVLALCLALAGPLRVEDPTPGLDHITRATVARAIADSNLPGEPPRTKLLIFTQETWEIAAGIALQLDRAGIPFVVLDQWVKVTGERHRWKDFPANPSLEHLELFRLHPRHSETTRQPAYALQKVGAALTIAPAVIDPADEKSRTVEFRPGGNNFLGFHVVGWSGRENWGVWNDGYLALLAFHPKATDGGDVDMRLDLLPLLAPAYGLTGQTLRVFFNGEQVGEQQTLTREDAVATLTIPAEQWNRAAAAPALVPSTLEFRFPDAVAPYRIDPHNTNGDTRLLAVGFHDIEFREEENPATATGGRSAAAPSVRPGGVGRRVRPSPRRGKSKVDDAKSPAKQAPVVPGAKAGG